MSHYTDGAALAENIGGTRYRLTKSIVWRVGSPNGPVFVVPVGFEFDVSVPIYLQLIFSPHDPSYFKASALHDKMLADGWSRITAGAEFHNALKADGVGEFTRLAMWLAVSLWKYGDN